MGPLQARDSAIFFLARHGLHRWAALIIELELEGHGKLLELLKVLMQNHFYQSVFTKLVDAAGACIHRTCPRSSAHTFSR